ncbi:SDR family NAD(P)-dependent oxidoreductase [Streptomyces sp. NPDC058423]|uniref:SDR family NAD(P)-dependent oxidoreductase n=1 Tax=unclassified Streptomyces TaxID=2593676 RepID=UPI003652BCA4
MTNQTSGQRAVAITGAGTGLGRELALELAASHRVFGTALTADEAAEVNAASHGGVVLTVCDITNEASVARWVDQVTRSLGESGLDVLVSNAAVVTPGPLELLALDRVRHEFEVNVFGAMSVVNAFLPALRQARGRIIQIGSTSARFPLPFLGMLGASKAAMDTIADAYRMELKQFGVEVVVAVPGSMRTGSQERVAADLLHLAASLTEEQRALYGKSFGRFVDGVKSMEAGGITAADATSEVMDLMERIPAPGRAPVGDEAREIARLVQHAPESELEGMRLRLVGMVVD